jgi:CHAT domain-containing protein
VGEFGETDIRTAQLLGTLARTASRAGNDEAAAKAYARSVAIKERVYGKNDERLRHGLVDLGYAELSLGRRKPAFDAFTKAFTIARAHWGDASHIAAQHAAHVAKVFLNAGDVDRALSVYRKSTTVLTTQDWGNPRLMLAAHAFVGFADALQRSADAGRISQDAAANEGLLALQKLWANTAGSAVAKMTEKARAVSPEVAAMIREARDAEVEINILQRQLDAQFLKWIKTRDAFEPYVRAKAEKAAFDDAQAKGYTRIQMRAAEIKDQTAEFLRRCKATPAAEGCHAKEARVTAANSELTALEKERDAMRSKAVSASWRLDAVEAKVPGYAAYEATMARLRGTQGPIQQRLFELREKIAAAQTSQSSDDVNRPLPLTAIQKELRAGEGLVVILPSYFGSGRVWLIRKDRARSGALSFGPGGTSRGPLALKSTLDPQQFEDGIVLDFDFKLSHRLYEAIFADIETELEGLDHLIFVGFGDAAAIPPQVLVREMPDGALSAKEQLRTARWLVRDFAVSASPSVQSFVAQRRLPPLAGASKPYLGIANPVLDGPPRVAEASRDQIVRGAKLPRLETLYRGGAVDVAAVRALIPLPDTEGEVRSIARSVGAQSSDLLVGDDATETRVKSLNLRDYRVVHFATHGLVEGDLRNLEPALVLTPPEEGRADDADDGLLTASEIARLDLNADLVVLSACNTAAGSTIIADAFSGLASAFFIAGARTLMVSHWSVISEAAVELTTGTFARLTGPERMTRAEALRRAMVAAIDAGRGPHYWAPFTIFGDGGARSVN